MDLFLMHPTSQTNPTQPKREEGNAQIRRRTLETRHDTRVEKPIRSQLLFHKEEGRQTTTSTGLSTNQQMDKEEPKRFPVNPTNHRPTQWVYSVHQVRCPLGIQQHSN